MLVSSLVQELHHHMEAQYLTQQYKLPFHVKCMSHLMQEVKTFEQSSLSPEVIHARLLD